MSTQSHSVTLHTAGERLIVMLPFNPDEVWGQKERHHITGSVNGHKVRGALEYSDGVWTLALGPAWQRGIALKAGMQVKLVLEPEGPQTNTLAEDLLAALQAEPKARAFFDSLATFYRKGYLRWVDGARKPELRAARITELIELLKEGKKERPR